MIGTAEILALLALVNAGAFLAFGFDKMQAERRGRRVRESTLLMLALLGGMPGAYAGRAAFRHKTRKQPFNHYLRMITLIYAGAAAWLGWHLATG